MIPACCVLLVIGEETVIFKPKYMAEVKGRERNGLGAEMRHQLLSLKSFFRCHLRHRNSSSPFPSWCSLNPTSVSSSSKHFSPPNVLYTLLICLPNQNVTSTRTGTFVSCCCHCCPLPIPSTERWLALNRCSIDTWMNEWASGQTVFPNGKANTLEITDSFNKWHGFPESTCLNKKKEGFAVFLLLSCVI